MNVILQSLGSFFTMAVVAIFVQNAVFTRGLGASRLVKLVNDSTVDSLIFCALLCVVQVISMPLAYVANLTLRDMLPPAYVIYLDGVRPLVFSLCAVIAFVLIIIFVVALRLPDRKNILYTLPMSAFNLAVLGPMLLMDSYNYSFTEAMGFALGSGLGYSLAVLLVSEGIRKLNNRSVPPTFRGLPITLIYMGILALAIYGLSGHGQAF